MRVLFVFFVPILRHVGGTQKVIDSLTLELQRRGHEVSFLNYLYGRIPEDYRFPAPQYYIDVRKLPKEQWAEEYRRILDERRIDVVVNLSNDEWVHFFLAHTPVGIRRISVNHLQPFAGFEHIGKSYRVMPAATLKEKVLKYMGIVAPALVRWLLGKPASTVLSASPTTIVCSAGPMWSALCATIPLSTAANCATSPIPPPIRWRSNSLR